MSRPPSSFRSARRAPDPRRRLLWLLLGWCLATGAPWDLVQVFAWGRMWAGHLQTRSPAAALAATFDPAEVCGLCEVVQEARTASARRDTPPPPSAEKATLLPIRSEDRIGFDPPAVSVAKLHPGLAVSRGRARGRPPLPPPRGRR